MRSNSLLLALAMLFCNVASPQLCPGGGTSFAGSVTFDQSWISGCTTGTSCTGGTTFDNRAACQPTTTMDACAPNPSCTSNTNGSNLWFKFYAMGTTASINIIQSVSFIAVIQAFSNGTCGSLTEIGCALAGGPSSGVTLNLSGLTTGHLYYFRIFGSSNSASQRTGVFCFCGSTGLGSTILPVALTSFTAEQVNNRNVILKWTTSAEVAHKYFIIEHSSDGINFLPLRQFNAKGGPATTAYYEYTDDAPTPGQDYYRLKIVGISGETDYSKTVSVSIKKLTGLGLYPNPARDKVVVSSTGNTTALITSISGLRIKMINLVSGQNEINTTYLPAGVYYLKSNGSGETISFTIVK